MLALVLALTSSLSYGTADFLGGLTSRTVALPKVLLLSQSCALLLLVVVVPTVAGQPPGGSWLAFAALAGLCETVGIAALYRGLATGIMSIVAPVAASAPIVPVMAGALLGPAPTPAQSVGIATVVTGIVLTSRSRSTHPATNGVTTSLLHGSLAALGFGGFYVAMNTASDTNVAWSLLAARITAVTIFTAAAVIARRSLHLRRTDFTAPALIGVLVVGADAAYAVASTHELLGIVAVLSSLHPLATVGLARVHLHERLQRLQQLGVALCLGGIVTVSAA